MRTCIVIGVSTIDIVFLSIEYLINCTGGKKNSWTASPHVSSAFVYVWIDLISPSNMSRGSNSTLRTPSPVLPSPHRTTALTSRNSLNWQQHLPASEDRLDIYRQAQKDDPTCSIVREYCLIGWPEQSAIDPRAKPFWEKRGELTVNEELLLCGTRIVIPTLLQEQTLEKLHQGHQGIERCRLRAQISVWWPGISREIVRMIERCPQCSRDRVLNREPLIPTSLPHHPWQKVGSDLFMRDDVTYLLVVDYYSRYPEVIQLKTTTTQSIIHALRSIFSRHGIPQILMSDNGPQYSSQEFAAFASQYGFTHTTSSPHYPQSNGLAERTVKTAKGLLKESTDPHLGAADIQSYTLAMVQPIPSRAADGKKTPYQCPSYYHIPCTTMGIPRNLQGERQREKGETETTL